MSMMDTQLTVAQLTRRLQLFSSSELGVRTAEGVQRTTYSDVASNARRLGGALHGLGLERGDRVATLCWNHRSHLEAYLGVPSAGLVLHTLNPRLHPNDLRYITNHSGARVLIVDPSLAELADQFVASTGIERVLVTGQPLDDLVASTAELDDQALDELEPAMLCYTSGTTGLPKGVLYTHRSIVLHALAVTAALSIARSDVICPVVPMFHAACWGYPFIAALTGAKLFLGSGPGFDPATLLEDLTAEQVTWSAGVPTIWLAADRVLADKPYAYDLSQLRGIHIGGAAAPRELIASFRRRGIMIRHGWGMTETSPAATVTSGFAASSEGPKTEAAALDELATQGQPLPLIDLRIRDVAGDELPWDGAAAGELEVRGPWVAAAYDGRPDTNDQWTTDGWLRTGDLASIRADGSVVIRDRIKDVIKSGGEWISSADLENELMSFPPVAEAAVIAVPDPHWGERPLAIVRLTDGVDVANKENAAASLRGAIAHRFAKWQLPDRFEFVDEIPKTGSGKFDKVALRDRYVDGPRCTHGLRLNAFCTACAGPVRGPSIDRPHPRQRWWGATRRRVPEIAVEGELDVDGALIFDAPSLNGDEHRLREAHAAGRPCVVRAANADDIRKALAYGSVSCVLVPPARRELCKLDLLQLTYP